MLRLDKPASLKDLKAEFKNYFLEHKLDKCITCAKEIRQHHPKQQISKLIDSVVNQYKKEQDAGWDDVVINIDEYEAELFTLLCKDENKYLLDETPPAAKQSASGAKLAAEESKESKSLVLSPTPAPTMAPETKSFSDLTVKIASLEDCIAKLKTLEKSFSLETAEAVRRFLTQQIHEYNKHGPLSKINDLAVHYFNLYPAYLRNDIFPLYFFDEVIAIFHQRMVFSSYVPSLIREIMQIYLEKLSHAKKLQNHLSVKITWQYFLDFAFTVPVDARWEIFKFIESYPKKDELVFRSNFLNSEPTEFELIKSFKNSLPYLSTLQSGARVTFSKEDFKYFPSRRDFSETTKLIASKETKLSEEITNKFKLIGKPICFSEYYDAMREIFPELARQVIDSSFESAGVIIKSKQEYAILTYFYLKLLSQKAGSPSLPAFYSSGGLAQVMSGMKLANQPSIALDLSNNCLMLDFNEKEVTFTDAAIERLQSIALLVRASIVRNYDELKLCIPISEVPAYFSTLLGYEYDVRQAEQIHKIVSDALITFSFSLVGIVNGYVGNNLNTFDLPLISADPDDEYNKMYAHLDHAEKFTEQECHSVYKDILRYIEFLDPNPIMWLANIRERLSKFNHPFRIEQNILNNLNKLFKLGIRLFNPNHTFLNHLTLDEKVYIKESLAALVSVSAELLQKVQMQASLPSTAASMWHRSVTKPSTEEVLERIHKKPASPRLT